MTPESEANACIGTLAGMMPKVYQELRLYITERIRIAVAEEREACALIADVYDAETQNRTNHFHYESQDDIWEATSNIAAMIRNRGGK